MIRRILIVDDDPDILLLLTRSLTLVGPDYQLEVCQSGTEALTLGQIRPFDLVISDYSMDDLNGLQLASKLKERQPELKVILMSGNGYAGLAQKTAEAGLNGFISKPFKLAKVFETVRAVLEA
ncbi:MAG TPA: response regulator [Anaerolineae bacterium]|nr:response regulator [Anaerolineae bacterium]MCB0181936.1 response regulator [Anaerolineae bacterium]MCB0223071.1 response regulator [Anaerolineae bacterium]MCB9104730.1 response regulator [Anaerolineales bacterium]HRV90647.1 response regulator [Anaerolineae bacterium]